MTKELKLEECVNLLSGTASTGAAISSTSSSGAHHHHHHHLHHNKPLSLLPPSPYVSGSSGTSPGRDQNSTYAGQNLITSTPRAMIRRNSKNHLTGGYQCTVRLLDDAEILQCEFQPHHKGQFIMDFVCRQLNIAEKDYFGLRYVDTNKQRHWLDLSKSIVKQLRDMAYIVCFRFKFYPNDPMLLKEEVSRYQLVLQLRRDILHGRLYSTLSDMATLASFIIQSELGDHDPEVHTGNYISDYELVSRQSHELEEKAMELHQKLKGLTPSEADILFLKKAATLDTYGIDPHPVKDQQGEQVYLGINHTGISTFQGSRKSTHFKWSQITKLNYEAKMFIIHLSIPEDARTKKKETVGFKCQTSSSCKYLWRSAVEQRLFFTCGCAGDIPSSVRGGGIFGTRFRYSGRVQREILEDPGPLRASDSVISRTPLTRSLQRNKTRSLPHTPLQIGYGSLPRSNHSAPPHESARLEGAMGTLGSSTSLPLSTLSSPYCPEHTLPLLETLREDSPRVEEKGPDGSGSEPVSRNLSNILEKALDERVEKEFLSTQEETLTSIPEDPEPEAEIIDDQASKIEAQLSATYSATSTTTTSASTAPTATSTNVETKQLSKDNLIANPNKPSGKLAVGNGSAIFHKQLNTKPSSTSDDADDISDDDIDGDDDKYKYDENMFDGKVEVDGNDNLREPLTIKDEIPPLAQALEKKAGPSIESNNNSAFVPVYNTTDASEGVRLSTDDKVLRDSKIDQVASISSVSSSASSYGKRSQAPQGALLSVWKVFVVCFICVLIALLFVAILAIEIDIDICRKMRRIPEVEIFQTEVYEPLKRFISNKIFSTSVSGSGRQVV